MKSPRRCTRPDVSTRHRSDVRTRRGTACAVRHQSLPGAEGAGEADQVLRRYPNRSATRAVHEQLPPNRLLTDFERDMPFTEPSRSRATSRRPGGISRSGLWKTNEPGGAQETLVLAHTGAEMRQEGMSSGKATVTAVPGGVLLRRLLLPGAMSSPILLPALRRPARGDGITERPQRRGILFPRASLVPAQHPGAFDIF